MPKTLSNVSCGWWVAGRLVIKYHFRVFLLQVFRLKNWTKLNNIEKEVTYLIQSCVSKLD